MPNYVRILGQTPFHVYLFTIINLARLVYYDRLTCSGIYVLWCILAGTKMLLTMEDDMETSTGISFLEKSNAVCAALCKLLETLNELNLIYDMVSCRRIIIGEGVLCRRLLH